jgi:drug/metabolite transporter (DMT)-like permease
MTGGAILLAIFCATLWGGLAVAIQFTQDELPPLGTAGLRFALSSIVLVIWARTQQVDLRVAAAEWVPILVVAAMLFLQIGSFHFGLGFTSSAHGSILIGANPVWVVLLAHFTIRGEPLNLGKVWGVALAVAGLVALVVGPNSDTEYAAPLDQVTLFGDLVILGSGIVLGVKTIYTKTVLARITAFKLITWSNIAATFAFLIYSLACEELLSRTMTRPALWGLLYQGWVVAGFCFIMWAKLLQKHPAGQLAMFGFLQPVTGAVFGVLFRGDPPTIWLLVAGLLVGGGIILVSRSQFALSA